MHEKLKVSDVTETVRMNKKKKVTGLVFMAFSTIVTEVLMNS